MTDERRLLPTPTSDIARALLPEFGFSSDQFGCLDSLWTRESNWRVNADNPTSSAYGIPQALPGARDVHAPGADFGDEPGDPDPLGPGLRPSATAARAAPGLTADFPQLVLSPSGQSGLLHLPHLVAGE